MQIKKLIKTIADVSFYFGEKVLIAVMLYVTLGAWPLIIYLFLFGLCIATYEGGQDGRHE